MTLRWCSRNKQTLDDTIAEMQLHRKHATANFKDSAIDHAGVQAPFLTAYLQKHGAKRRPKPAPRGIAQRELNQHLIMLLSPYFTCIHRGIGLLTSSLFIPCED